MLLAPRAAHFMKKYVPTASRETTHDASASFIVSVIFVAVAAAAFLAAGLAAGDLAAAAAGDFFSDSRGDLREATGAGEVERGAID